jgi:hypothetical protein
VRETAYEFVAGRHSFPHASILVAALCAVGIAFLVARTNAEEKRGGLVFAAVAVSAVALPLLATAADKDYWYYRNLIGAWIPLAIVLAAGLGARAAGRPGLAIGGLLVVCSVVLTAAVVTSSSHQRDDWRGLADCLGPPSPTRAIVLRLAYEAEPLRLYRPGIHALTGTSPPISELVLVGVDGRRAYRVPGFASSNSGCSVNIPVVRLKAEQPRPVDIRAVIASIPHHDEAGAFADRRPAG